MADEPERRLVGAISAELEQQRHDQRSSGTYMALFLDTMRPNGTQYIDGEIDLYLLARAIIKEVKENPL